MSTQMPAADRRQAWIRRGLAEAWGVWACRAALLCIGLTEWGLATWLCSAVRYP